MNNEAVATLLSMGFDETQSLDALTECNGNVERAIDFLLGGGFFDDTNVVGSSENHNNESAHTETNIIQSDVSQYTDPSVGRSACTSIALTLASRALTELRQGTVEDVINSVFLSDSIMQGLQSYNVLQQNNNSGVEHLSVEEILQLSTAPMQAFSSLKLLLDSPRQGILSSAENPLGLQSILSACRSDARNSQSYLAVVITKPPETVLVLLPPNTASATQQKYVLLDSHPRPNQFAPHYPSGSFALFHSDLQSLVGSLAEIFPVVDLGSDVNEMMAMMYNSFDVYPFELNVG
jgi:hypothetical protein